MEIYVQVTRDKMITLLYLVLLLEWSFYLAVPVLTLREVYEIFERRMPTCTFTLALGDLVSTRRITIKSVTIQLQCNLKCSRIIFNCPTSLRTRTWGEESFLRACVGAARLNNLMGLCCWQCSLCHHRSGTPGVPTLARHHRKWYCLIPVIVTSLTLSSPPPLAQYSLCHWSLQHRLGFSLVPIFISSGWKGLNYFLQ